MVNWYKFNQPYSFVYYSTLIDAATITTTQQSNLNLYTTAPNSNGINLYFNQIRAYFGQSIADQILNEFLPNSNLYVDKLMLNEWHIYGSSRLGIYKAEVLVASKTLTQSDAQSANGNEPTYSAVEQNPPVLDYASYSQIRGAKNYELSNHLGNVLVVVTDKKTYNCGNSELINANFDNGSYSNIFPITGNTSMSLSGNKLNVSGTNTQVGTLFNTEGEAGRIFKVDFDLTIGSGISQVWFETNASYNSTGGGFSQNVTNSSSSGHVSFTFTAPLGAYRFKIGGTGTGTYSVDNLIVKEVGPGRYQAEIVTANDYSPFGAPMPGRSFKADNVLVKTTLSTSNFATGTDGWVATTNATLSNVFGNIRATVTAVNAGMKKTFSTEPGKTYRVMFKINLRGWPYLYIKDKYTNTNLLSITNFIVPGDASYTFTATGFETDVIFNEAVNPAGSIQLANFTLEEVEANSGYRFSFNGQEKDDEVSGAGNTMTAEFWEYDARLGRRFNRDPKPNHFISEYVCFANNPIFFKDHKGDTIRTSLFGPEVEWPTKVKAAGDYKKRYDDGVFVFTLHGSENGVQIGYPKLTKKHGTRNGNGGDDKGRNQQYFEDNIPDIYKEFVAACPEFKNSLEMGKKITIILQSCHTGDGDNPIAQKIADYNANVTVVAPNGYVSTWDNYVRTNDDDNELDENGKFKRYKGTGFYTIFRKDKEVEPIKKPINLN